MEQWVSDTFYSYFPGYNNENQKRQHYLRERQAANQQNFLKHQMSQQQLAREKATVSTNVSNADTPRSGIDSQKSSGADKTELQIIVNNPNYVSASQAAVANTRPGSTRHKLLQDLRHTELSQVLNGEGVNARNRRNVELETARKKDYQRELMQQIEEKRRTIEKLREKERQQDALLTKRLQEQLQTIHLEEQLEKERLHADKLRFDAQQSRLMREQLLAKLETDAKLLNSNKNRNTSNDNNSKINSSNEKKSNLKVDTQPLDEKDAVIKNNNNNKVYKYFSNSARHEYRRGRHLDTDVELDLDALQSPSTAVLNDERECFHLSEKVCPMCDAPLRNYENCCLRCQRKLSLRLAPLHPHEHHHHHHQQQQQQPTVTSEKSTKARCCKSGVNALMQDKQQLDAENGNSFSLVCVNCERLYTLCSSCVTQRDVCRACHRKRNVCMSCRRTLCTFCLEEIASGRDTERQHINESTDNFQKQINKTEEPPHSERSFQVLDVQYDFSGVKESDNADFCTSATPTPRSSHTNYTHIHNNLQSSEEDHNDNDDDDETNKLPCTFSLLQSDSNRSQAHTKVAKESYVFEQLPKIIDKSLSFDYDDTQMDAQSNMERVRRETDKRLSRYLKNYGDLTLKPTKTLTPRSKSEARNNRGTQTTPDSAARRDIVLHEEHNLSMPLLREMPKMTRKENSNSLLGQAMQNQRKIDNLKRRWEIPAVQKFSISPNNPKVLTQVGAIRQQLQAQCLRDEEQNY